MDLVETDPGTLDANATDDPLLSTLRGKVGNIAISLAGPDIFFIHKRAKAQVE